VCNNWRAARTLTAAAVHVRFLHLHSCAVSKEVVFLHASNRTAVANTHRTEPRETCGTSFRHARGRGGIQLQSPCRAAPSSTRPTSAFTLRFAPRNPETKICVLAPRSSCRTPTGIRTSSVGTHRAARGRRAAGVQPRCSNQCSPRSKWAGSRRPRGRRR